MEAATAKFLRFLFEPYSPDLTIEIRPFHPAYRGSKAYRQSWHSLTEIGRCLTEAGRLKDNYDVYFGVLPRISGGGGAEFLREAAFLWVDFDAGCGSREETLTFAKERIAALELPIPNALVCSGGGWHGYWKLAEVVPVGTSEERESFKKILTRLVRAIGGDLEKAHACPKATDCARILRLPGTSNLKIQDCPRAVEVKRLKEGGEKSLLWWKANLPSLPLPASKKFVFSGGVKGSPEFELPWLTPQMEAWLTEAAPKGKRHYSLVDAATRMRKNDQSETDTLRILLTKAQNSGVDISDRDQQDHIEGIVEWVFLHVQVDEDRPRYYRGVKIGNR